MIVIQHLDYAKTDQMLLNVFATNGYYVHTVVEEAEEEGKTVFTVCCVAFTA